MEFTVLITAIMGVVSQVAEWIKVAEEIKEVEDAGGPVSQELRNKAREARMAAQAVMHASRGPGVAMARPILEKEEGSVPPVSGT